MKCNICGREIANEEANFCEYCGCSFREPLKPPYQMPPQGQGFPYSNGQIADSVTMQGYGMTSQQAEDVKEKPTTFLNWLGTYGILFIPIAGWLVFLIMLFIWSFGDSASTSKKNWARATLIFTAVIIVIFIVYLLVIINSSMFQDMMNGTFDYNSYLDSLKNQQ